jgi:hypothetical protein
MKRVILIFALLFSFILSYSQREEEIYTWIFVNYLEKLRPPNIDYSSGSTVIVLNRPNNMAKLDTHDYTRFKEKYSKIEFQTFINFIQENQLNLNYEKINIYNTKVVILENKLVPSWKELISKYPDWIYSIIEFSNIGFNDAKSQALVYYGFYSGPGVGGGCFLVLENNGRKWKCKKVIQAWAA